MYAVDSVVRLFVEQGIKIHESNAMHLADGVIQRIAPHVIESYGRGAGRRHPWGRVRRIVRIESANDYLHAFGGGHGRHYLQVVTGIARVDLKKIVPPSHDH